MLSYQEPSSQSLEQPSGEGLLTHASVEALNQADLSGAMSSVTSSAGSVMDAEERKVRVCAHMYVRMYVRMYICRVWRWLTGCEA